MNKWDLSKLYENDEAFEKDLYEIKSLIATLSSFKGKLGDEEELCKYLRYSKEANRILEKAYSFASMRSDLNKKDVKNNEAVTRCRLIVNDLISATSFESPEILALGKEKMDAFFAKHEDLKEFEFGYEKLFHANEHVLDANSERLLSYFGPISNEGSELYSMLAVGDYVPTTVTLQDGKKITVTQGNWRSEIEKASTAEDRRIIFEAIFNYYAEHKNTFGQIYNTVLESELADMKSRNYSSILESHLFNNNIPTSVYKTLVEVTSTHTEPLKKYYELRRKYFKLDKHRSYDRFLQMSSSSKEYTYDEAKELFFKSIAKFDDDFVMKAHEVLKEGYVDVYETEGKRSGAYSSGGNGIHPFILLNYDNSLDSVFTVAHEAGHSIHTLYSTENQPLMLQGYTIFVAEIASTFNEHNLLDYFIESGEASKEEKILLLQKAIDEIVATYYRQTLFAQYELELSELAEKGQPINYQVCSNKMKELYTKYYGIDIEEEKVKEFVWAYIPHLFYTPFYVYQYATSFAASLKIYENVKKEGKVAFERYKGLLKAGGSKYPTVEAKEAGVDFEDPNTFLAVTNRLETLVNELEELIK